VGQTVTCNTCGYAFMGMIGSDDVGEFDERLRRMFETLIQSKSATPDDAEAVRRFLEWVIYPDWDRDPKHLDVRSIEWSEGLNEVDRALLIEIARSGAALVRSGKNRDKPPLIEQCKLMLKMRCIPFAEADDEPAKKFDRRTEARDKFIYQKACKSAPAKQILGAIDQHPDWELPKSADEMFEIAKRYAQRHNLPLPPPR
jgi:hypothetical protein